MSPLLRDLFHHYPSLTPTDKEEGYIEALLKILHRHGVVIGGTYQHFKGGSYRVLGVLRDADDWDGEWLVRYADESFLHHEAVRKLSEFLGDVDKPEYKGPRFRFMGGV